MDAWCQRKKLMNSKWIDVAWCAPEKSKTNSWVKTKQSPLPTAELYAIVFYFAFFLLFCVVVGQWVRKGTIVHYI